MKTIVKAALLVLLVPPFAGFSWMNFSLAQSAPDQTEKDAVRSMARSVCATCHGIDGRSTDSMVPNLAGQQRTYIEIQLKAFRVQTRRDPDAHSSMWGIASAWLNDDKIVAEIGNYYASLPPAPGKSSDPAAAALGKKLFEKSSADRSIRACTECHGKNAEGAFFFPRLAGQQPDYLARQIKMMRLRLRDSPIMHGVIKDLTDSDVVALVAYLQSQ
jgi:cytochrome c553